MMLRRAAVLLLITTTLVVAPISSAAAQSGATIDATPATVSAAGATTFTVSGTGWDAPSPYFVLPCAVPESLDVADVDTDTCDSGALVTAVVDVDGNLSATITIDIGPGGALIYAINGDQSQAAGVIVSLDDGSSDGGELPRTGAGTTPLAIIGLALLTGGALAVSAGIRR